MKSTPPSTAPAQAQAEPQPQVSARPQRARVLWGIAISMGWVLVAAGAVMAAAGIWVRRNFGVVSLDQLMMNLPAGGAQGAGGNEIVVNGVLWVLIVPLLAVLVLAVCVELARRSLRKRAARDPDHMLAQAVAEAQQPAQDLDQDPEQRPAPVPTRPRRQLWVRGLAATLAVAVPVAGAATLSSTIGVKEYVESYVREAVTGTTLGDFYAVPPLLNEAGTGPSGSAQTAKTASRATKPGAASGDEHRNLIVIYLESIEDSLSDDSLFEINMLEPIQRATEGWSSIEHLEQYAGGGWTMAGIVSTQCGVPLRSAGATADKTELNLMGAEGEAVDSYLPGAVCLGDVLQDRGYRNVFLGGADANFASKGTFLRTHGYEEVHDLIDWQAAGETEANPAWGLSDRRLFELAAETVSELHDAGEPFNLTLLTLDSHEFPFAYDYCDIDTEAPMAAITRCSMEQVAGFIDYLGQQGYLEDTAVMVMGDHEKFIAEANSFEAELSSLDDHPIFNRLWLPEGANLTIAQDRIDQLSMYPTMLEMAGIEVPDHRAGIGVSAFTGATPEGSTRELDDTAYRNVVTSLSSAFYRELWGTASTETLEAAATSPTGKRR